MSDSFLFRCTIGRLLQWYSFCYADIAALRVVGNFWVLHMDNRDKYATISKTTSKFIHITSYELITHLMVPFMFYIYVVSVLWYHFIHYYIVSRLHRLRTPSLKWFKIQYLPDMWMNIHVNCSFIWRVNVSYEYLKVSFRWYVKFLYYLIPPNCSTGYLDQFLESVLQLKIFKQQILVNILEENVGNCVESSISITEVHVLIS